MPHSDAPPAPKVYDLAEGHKVFARLLNAGDLEGLVALYAENAKLVLDGKEYAGREAIRGVLKGFVDLKPAFEVKTLLVTQNGGLGVTQGQWKLKGTAPDGSPVHMSGLNAEVSERQKDGSWLYSIDIPALPAAATSLASPRARCRPRRFFRLRTPRRVDVGGPARWFR
jgi:ketosteroid isomerase-like protein